MTTLHISGMQTIRLFELAMDRFRVERCGFPAGVILSWCISKKSILIRCNFPSPEVFDRSATNYIVGRLGSS
jgi:hypothetical protein